MRQTFCSSRPRHTGSTCLTTRLRAAAPRHPSLQSTPLPSRREAVLLGLSLWPLLLIGTTDPTTVINSVLGGYFLPRLPSSQVSRPRTPS